MWPPCPGNEKLTDCADSPFGKAVFFAKKEPSAEQNGSSLRSIRPSVPSLRSDGQHTIEIIAAKSGSRDTPVWCMIYDELEYREEAHICAEQQKNHLHYITDDESECSVCGARFSKKLASCPQCGAQFDSAETDEEEWYEEFDEECAWDEEEGW